jgi:tetratricopeptide (TPR) repeat protein
MKTRFLALTIICFMIFAVLPIETLAQCPSKTSYDAVTRGKELTETDSDKAIAAFAEAIKLSANNAHAYVLRGEVYLQKKNYSRAIADFTEALKIDFNCMPPLPPDIEGKVSEDALLVMKKLGRLAMLMACYKHRSDAYTARAGGTQDFQMAEEDKKRFEQNVPEFQALKIEIMKIEAMETMEKK